MYTASKDIYSNIEDGEQIRIDGVVCDRESFENTHRYTIRVGGLYNKCFLYTDEGNLYIGDKVSAIGVKQSFEEARNDGQFDARAYYLTKNIRFSVEDAKIEGVDKASFSFGEILRSFREDIAGRIDSYNVKNSELLKGIILGDKSGIEDYEKELYQRGGISHILSISGLHVTNLSMILYFVLEKTRLPRRIAKAFSVIFLVIYALFSGFSSSVVRAVSMFVVAQAAAGKGRKYDIPTALSVSFFVYTVLYPFSVFAQGTILSYLACVAIWLFSVLYKKIHIYKTDDKRKKILINKLYKPFALGLFLNFFSLPFVLYFFYTIPFLSVLVNLYVVPMMTVLFIFGILVIVFSFINGFIACTLTKVCGLIISSFTGITEFSTNITDSVVAIGKPQIHEIIIYYIIMFISLFLLTKIQHKWRAMLLMLIPIFILVYKVPKASVTMLDVDQGDCFVITTADKKVYMIDCGSTGEKDIYKYTVEPYLLANGINKVDAVFLSHSDSDHINGIEQYLEKKIRIVDIANIIITPQMMADETVYESIISKANGINVSCFEAGEHIEVEGGYIKCLYPENTVAYEDTNSDSMVLEVSLNETDMLFTGDIPSEVEEYLKLGEYDILKVAHHGSKTSTSKNFLEKAKPRMALISCGRENSYGHPSKEVLESLESENVETYITTESGQVRLLVKNKQILLNEYLN